MIVTCEDDSDGAGEDGVAVAAAAANAADIERIAAAEESVGSREEEDVPPVEGAEEDDSEGEREEREEEGGEGSVWCTKDVGKLSRAEEVSTCGGGVRFAFGDEDWPLEAFPLGAFSGLVTVEADRLTGSPLVLLA